MQNPDLTSALNNLLADTLLMIVRLHNYHWNVKGCHFTVLHALTEEYYSYFAKQFDALGERILQIGGVPLVTVSAMLQAARLPEDGRTAFSKDMVLAGMVESFDLIGKQVATACAAAGEAGDKVTEDLLIEFAAWLEKTLWMARSTLGGGEERFHQS